MPDWGYGSPTSATGATGTQLDSGYGSPLAAGTGDTGYGSPWSALVASALKLNSADGKFPDEGGVLASVVADWPVAGPFRVRLYDQAGVAYPNSDYCHSGLVGGGRQMSIPAAGLDEVKFVVPPLPVGLYDIRVDFGPGFGASATLLQALLVVTRGRVRNTFDIRGRMPPLYRTGPAVSSIDPLLP